MVIIAYDFSSTWIVRTTLYPLAVLRSRLLLQKQHTVYRSTLEAFISISKKEGFRGLFRVGSSLWSGIAFFAPQWERFLLRGATPYFRLAFPMALCFPILLGIHVQMYSSICIWASHIDLSSSEFAVRVMLSVIRERLNPAVQCSRFELAPRS